MTTFTISQSLRSLVDEAKEIEALLDAPWHIDPREQAKVQGRASGLLRCLRIQIETQAMRAEFRERMERERMESIE